MNKWIALCVLIFSCSILGYFYVELENTRSESFVTPPPVSSAIRVVHSYKDGVHRYTGTVKLPHSCYGLTPDENPTSQKDPEKFVIILISTDRLLEQRLCAKISTRYPFEVITDAPEHIITALTLDGVEMPIHLVETMWQNPKGTTVFNPNQAL